MSIIILNEEFKGTDSLNMGLKGEVELIRNGKAIFKKRPNIVLRRGRGFILEKLFNFVIRDTPNYNTSLKEFEEKYEIKFGEQPLGRTVCLFSAGIGSCTLLWKSTKKPTFDLMNLREPIPFLITDIDEVLNDDEKNKYFGKKPLLDEDGTHLYDAYYYKKIKNFVPKIGGTSGDADECYVETEIPIEDRDFKDFFDLIEGDPDNGRINEILISFAVFNEEKNDYDMIEPFSMLAFNNVGLEGDLNDTKFIYRFLA